MAYGNLGMKTGKWNLSNIINQVNLMAYGNLGIQMDD